MEAAVSAAQAHPVRLQPVRAAAAVEAAAAQAVPCLSLWQAEAAAAVMDRPAAHPVVRLRFVPDVAAVAAAAAGRPVQSVLRLPCLKAAAVVVVMERPATRTPTITREVSLL